MNENETLSPVHLKPVFALGNRVRLASLRAADCTAWVGWPLTSNRIPFCTASKCRQRVKLLPSVVKQHQKRKTTFDNVAASNLMRLEYDLLTEIATRNCVFDDEKLRNYKPVIINKNELLIGSNCIGRSSKF